MMSIEQTLAQARPAETMEVAQRVAQLRREGKDVISLAQGEPDFCTPEHIQQAAIDAMRAGKLGYTESAGLYVLREAIVSKLAADQKLAYSVEEISVTSGTKQAIFNAFFCSLTQGGEVVIPAPCWGSYPEVVKLTGGTPVIVECGAKAGFKIRPDDLERALSERTQWLMLNSPSNPTGAVYDPDELLAIAEVLRRHPHVRILSDDIYEKLVYGGTRFTQILEVAPDLRGRTLVVNGMSKCYSMTGWRLGYAAGAKDIISAMILVQGHSTSNANTASQYAAIAALTGDQSCVERFRKTFETRRDLTVAALRAIPGLDIATPDGAFYAYVSCKALLGRRTPDGRTIASDREFVAYLLDRAHVATVSGTGFLHSPYFRLSFAASTENLGLALQRIRQAVLDLRDS